MSKKRYSIEHENVKKNYILITENKYLVLDLPWEIAAI